MTSLGTATPHPAEPGVELDVLVELRLLDGELENIKAKIHRVSSGMFELSSPIHLRYDRRLEIMCDGRGIESRVVHCRREGTDKYHVAIRIAWGAHMRTEARLPIDLWTKLHMLGSFTPHTIRLVDLSPSGLGMELTTPLPVGARVSIDLGYGTVGGEIRYCERKVERYRAGIRILEFSRCADAHARAWTNLNTNSSNLAALAAFVRAIEERQSNSRAILFSLARKKAS